MKKTNQSKLSVTEFKAAYLPSAFASVFKPLSVKLELLKYKIKKYKYKL